MSSNKWFLINGTQAALWCVSCLFPLLLGSCEFRELTFEEEGIPFHITPDWSTLSAGEEKPRYIKALFFPMEGGAAIERFVSPEGGDVRVPPGEYRVIVYNWRTNAEVQTVQFRGDTYDTFEAYVAPRNTVFSTRSRASSLPLIPCPDSQLYGWNTAGETVTISETSPAVRTRASEGDALAVPMRQMVRSYVMAVSVSNAQYLSGISAVTTDAYGSIPLGGGTPTADSERYAVETKVERGTDAGGSCFYYCRVTTFGLFEDAGKTLTIDLTNTAGATHRVEVDITEALARVDMGEVEIDTPQTVIPPETPIVVPKPETPPVGDNSGFAPPSLSDWEEEDRDIFM